MLKSCKKLLYRINPRFPEDVQFAKRVFRQQVMLLSRGQDLEQVVAPQMLTRLQPFQQRGYSHLRIQMICAEAIQHLLIEKVLTERQTATS